MINYELQKELAEAGFPDNSFPGYKRGTNVEIDLALKTVHPSLSELIQACGDRFTNLHYSGTEGRWDSWSAISWNHDKSFANADSYGSTPEEAVARLWLELNKKQ